MNQQSRRQVLAEGHFVRLVRRDGWEWAERTNNSGVVVIVAINLNFGIYWLAVFIREGYRKVKTIGVIKDFIRRRTLAKVHPEKVPIRRFDSNEEEEELDTFDRAAKAQGKEANTVIIESPSASSKTARVFNIASHAEKSIRILTKCYLFLMS